MKMKRRILFISVLLLLTGCAHFPGHVKEDRQESEDQLHNQDQLSESVNNAQEEGDLPTPSPDESGNVLEETGNEDVDQIPGVPRRRSFS